MKKPRSFSLTDEEMNRIETNAKARGFAGRNEYFLALLECDESGVLSVSLDKDRNYRRVLRPMLAGEN